MLPFSIPGLDDPVEVPLTGFDLLKEPLLNKGTAFTEEERDAFGLHGLLPPHVGTLEEQVDRRLKALRGCHTDFERYAFLRDLQDTNETLFYALLVRQHRGDAAAGLHADGRRRLPALQRDLAQAARPVPQLPEPRPHSPRSSPTRASTGYA